MKVWLFFLTIFLILGCSSKKEKAFMKVYQENKIESKKLQNTEKIQLYNSTKNITKVLLTSTYISKKQKNKKIKNDEIFIIGIYVDDNETQNVNLENFSLRLNGKSPKSIKALSENSKWLKNIPFVFSWTQFYLVHFPYTPKKSMQLTVEDMLYGKGTAHFAKVAKYVLHKKAF